MSRHQIAPSLGVWLIDARGQAPARKAMSDEEDKFEDRAAVINYEGGFAAVACRVLSEARRGGAGDRVGGRFVAMSYAKHASMMCYAVALASGRSIVAFCSKGTLVGTVAKVLYISEGALRLKRRFA
jgi:hypothetical protein